MKIKIDFLLLTFFNFNNKLINEINGKVHEYQKEYDILREYLLNKIGCKVIRFTNEDIEKCIDEYLEKIK